MSVDMKPEASSDIINLPPQEEMLAAVGRALQIFAMVETSVSFVYASLMQPADRNSSLITLEAARHIKTKVAIVDAVASYVLVEDTLKKWKSLKNEVDSRERTRNKIVHSTVSYWPGIKSAAQLRKVKVALVPIPSYRGWAQAMYGGRKDKQSKVMLLKDLKRFHDQCTRLNNELIELSIDIGNSRPKT